MRRSRYKSPDGIDWRDPDMPVIRQYRMADGTRKEVVDQDYERRYREHMMSAAAQDSWRRDDTYNMRRRKRVD